MEIGIIGLGVVGSAVEHGFRKLGHHVKPHDIKYDTQIDDLLNCEVCYVCVPTPTDDEGACDVTIVEQVVAELLDKKYKGIVAIKSTVSPGTTERLVQKHKNTKICFVPEFLRERCAIVDFVENHDLCVVGTDRDDVYDIVKKSHGKYPNTFVKLSPTEAELTKYFNNVYNATLITFANSFFELCESLGANYTSVKDAITERNNISDVYLDCNHNIRGFGGMCLPKDTSALNHLVKEKGLNVDFFKMILDENNKYKTTVFEGMRK